MTGIREPSKKTLRGLLAFALLAPALACAHQDRIFSIEPDGSVPQLPAEYADTRIVLRFSDAPKPELLEFKVTSGGHTTSVLPCLLKLVKAASARDVKAAGSWYHEPSGLPPYIHIQFVADRKPTAIGPLPGPKFLFSLRDARLLRVEEVVIEDGGGSTRGLPVSAGNACPP